MIKYRVNKWNMTIERVEVAKETAKQVIRKIYSIPMAAGPSVAPSYAYIRENKASSSHEYHDTWNAAHNRLLTIAENKVVDARRVLAKADKKLKEVMEMKEPEQDQ